MPDKALDSKPDIGYNARCALQQALHFVASRTVSINDKALPPSGVEVYTPSRRKAFVPKSLRVFTAVSVSLVSFAFLRIPQSPLGHDPG